MSVSRPRRFAAVVAAGSTALLLGATAPVAVAETEPIGFAPAQTYPGALFSTTSVYQPAQITTGDFDGDGRIDLATNNCRGSGPLVFRNTGGGRFARARTVPTDRAQNCVVGAGDLNGDGRDDLLSGSWGSASLTVLLSNGDLTFRATDQHSFPGFLPMQTAVDDLDRDGVADIAALGNVPGAVKLLLGRGDGTFRAGGTVLMGGVSMSFTVGDFDRDGAPDLAASDIVAPPLDNFVRVRLNRGDGTFAPAQGVNTAGFSPEYLVSADLDADGKADIVAANANDGSLSLLYGRGDGSFDPEVSIPRLPGKPGVQVADFDGDGRLDIASTVTITSRVEVHHGLGGRRFVAVGSWSTAPALLPQSIVAADLDGDGRPDLATPGFLPVLPSARVHLAVVLNRSEP